MHLSLTSVLPFLAHDHASAVAFLTCRHHNFHASIIPEFLSDEERVRNFCEARQQNQLEADEQRAFKNLYNLFVQTPLMQFSPSLIVSHKDCADLILKPLLKTKYFTRSLQRCTFGLKVEVTDDLLQGLSKVQSLTKLDLGNAAVENAHLEIILNSFPSLEILTIENADDLDPETAINVASPQPAAMKTLRSLIMREMEPLFAARFVPHFSYLTKLKLSSSNMFLEIDLLSLSSFLPLLTDLSLTYFFLENTESLKNLVHLSSLEFIMCCIPDLSFLAQENSLPELRTLCIDDCGELLTSSEFASLTHAPNLHDLAVNSKKFDNDCLNYLDKMVHLRKLDLSQSKITGDGQSLQALMQNLFQLEELNVSCCEIGNRAAIAESFYSSASQLRVFDLRDCNLIDDDLNGISALKNTLEVLDLGSNSELTNAALVHCKDLVKLNSLNLCSCIGVDNLSALRGCLNLEKLSVWDCEGLTDDSFRVFSEEQNSFPNLRILNLSYCKKLTEKVFEHLSNNNHLVHQLKELNVMGMGKILASSATARNNLCQLQGLRILEGILFSISKSQKVELMQGLKNLEKISEY